MTQKNQSGVRDARAMDTSKTGTGGSADTRNPDWDSYVPEGQGQTDEQIRADVQEKLSAEKDLGATSTALSVIVSKGRVTLQGEVASRGVQQHLIELVRTIPSVQDVESKLRVVAQ